MDVQVNYVAVLVAGIIMMVLGYLWYGPLFGKPWMKLMGLSKSSMKGMKTDMMIKNYGLMFVSALILSYVAAFGIPVFQANSIPLALSYAFWIWLGFIATTMFGGVLWAKKPVKLFIIDSGYYLVGLIIISVMFALWQ